MQTHGPKCPCPCCERMSNLDRLYQLVEQKMVECPNLGFMEHRQCAFCHGTDKVADPTYAELRKVLTTNKDGIWTHENCSGVCQVHHQAGPSDCKGTGRILRNWEGKQDGAFRGALLVAALRAGLSIIAQHHPRFPQARELGQGAEGEILYRMTNDEAAQVVIEAIKAVKEEGDG